MTATSIKLATFVASAALSTMSHGATLQPLPHQPPDVVGLPFLLTDGTVMVQGSAGSNWWKLTPDGNGSYLNGTWSPLASIPYTWNYAPAAFASAVLADGRLLIAGGEYNENAEFSLTSKGALYDPVRDSWAPLPAPPGWDYIGDASSIVMPNGKFVLGDKLSTRIAELDPATMTWTDLGAGGKADVNAEEGWTLLPDGSILTVDVTLPPHTERYTYVDQPGGGHWSSAGDTPVSLDFYYGFQPVPYRGGFYPPPGETGPCILRPDRTVFCTGASDDQPANIAHTAVYSIVTGAWTRGPDFPPGDDAGDVSAVLLPNGKVLVIGVSGRFYEFDGAQLVQSGLQTSPASLLTLPNGQVLVTAVQQPNDSTLLPYVQIYTPDNNTPQPGWAPTIAQAPASVDRGASYTISGTQFNGLSQAQAFGDELVGPTNYPLVRITNNASGHMFFAHTHDHSSMGVATGATPVSTHFDVPAQAESGASTLVVIANGIASAPVNVTVSDKVAPFAISRGITGSWFNANQNGHGFVLEVLPGNPQILSAFWFVFAPNGAATWIAASGPVDGDHAALQAYQVAGSGAFFAPHFDPANVHAQPWGTLTFAFTGCSAGNVSWSSTAPGYGVGSLAITRLITPDGVHCP